MGIPTNFVSLPTISLVVPPCRRNQRFDHRATPKRAVVVAARGGDCGDYVGRSVDEDMLVLRKRLHEMKVAETGHAPPSDWMEWDKSYYDHYVEDVCGAVGLLQCYDECEAKFGSWGRCSCRHERPCLHRDSHVSCFVHHR